MIYAYGDSYLANSSYCLSWVQDLADKLKMRCFNKAVSGSSTEYSIKKFLIDRKDFIPGDIIIFSFSTVGRLSFKYINDELPESSCVFYGQEHKGSSKYHWYTENEKYLEWFVREVDFDLIDINFEGYHQIIRSFAVANPEITFIVLTNTKHRLYSLFDLEPLSNYIKPRFDLYSISTNEMINCSTYTDFVKYTKYDPRFNHLTNQNRKILVDILYESIVDKNFDKIQNINQFAIRIIPTIKNIKDYEKCLNAGHFNRNFEIISELKNTTS